MNMTSIVLWRQALGRYILSDNDLDTGIYSASELITSYVPISVPPLAYNLEPTVSQFVDYIRQELFDWICDYERGDDYASAISYHWSDNVTRGYETHTIASSPYWKLAKCYERINDKQPLPSKTWADTGVLNNSQLAIIEYLDTQDLAINGRNSAYLMEGTRVSDKMLESGELVQHTPNKVTKAKYVAIPSNDRGIIHYKGDYAYAPIEYVKSNGKERYITIRKTRYQAQADNWPNDAYNDAYNTPIPKKPRKRSTSRRKRSTRVVKYYVLSD